MILLYFLVKPSKYLSPNKRASLSASRLSKIFEIENSNQNLASLLPNLSLETSKDKLVLTCEAQDPQLAFPKLLRLLETQTPQIESQKWNDAVKAIQIKADKNLHVGCW